MKSLTLTFMGLLAGTLLSAQCHVYDVPAVDLNNSDCYNNDLLVDGNPIVTGTGIQPSGNSYQAFNSTYIHLVQGGNHIFDLAGMCNQAYDLCIWIDYDNDSVYTQQERVAMTLNSFSGSTQYSVVVPVDARGDTVHMRIMKLANVSGWGNGNDDACFAWSQGGEVEDYSVIIDCGNFNFANFDQFPTFCYADSVYLNAFTMYGDIAWYVNPPGAPDYIGNTFTFYPGSYTPNVNVYVQNIIGGCTNGPLMQMNITFNPTPVVNILGPDTVQSCSAVTFDAGPGQPNYQWNNGDQTQTTTISNGFGGPLMVQVTNVEGCTGSDQVWVHVAPNPPASYAQVQTAFSFCETHEVYLMYDSMISPGTVSWYEYPAMNFIGNSRNQSYILPGAGTFQFIGYINSACGLDTALLSINTQPSATYDSLYVQNAMMDSTGLYHICAGNGTIDIALGGLNGTVDHWEIGDTTLGFYMTIYDDSTLSLPASLMTAGHIYSAWAVIANSQGCTDTTEMIFSTPANTYYYSFPDTTWPCSFPLTYGIGSVNYAVYDIIWSTGDTTNTINVTAPGYFTISTIDHSSGCVASDHVYIGNGSMPDHVLPDTTVVCGGVAYFDPSPLGFNAMYWSEYDNTWSNINNDGNWNYTIMDNGFDEYLVMQAQNPHGCNITDTTFVDFGGNFTFSLGPDVVTVQNPYTVTGPAGYTNYMWSPVPGNTQSIQVTMSGTYSLTVDNGQGCTYTDVINITIDPMGVENATDAEVNVFPNPANDHLTVTSASTIETVNVYDAGGRLVSRQVVTPDATSVEVDVTALAEGCYFMEVLTENGLSRERFIISR